MDQEAAVREAFSRQAPVFDALEAGDPLLAWIRQRAQREAIAHMRPGSTLLELNAGTGIDSFYFAAQGIRVTATDNATGMVDRMRARQAMHPELAVEVLERSSLYRDHFGDRRFEHVFGNCGGINCTPQLDRVLNGIDRVLTPGGTCTLVIMPRLSPWEMVEFLRGNFAQAFRRFARDGAMARMEGISFRCWYHSSQAVRNMLPDPEVLSPMALSFFVPPPHLAPFAAKCPALVRIAKRLEELSCRWPLIRSCGDHFLITLRKPWHEPE